MRTFRIWLSKYPLLEAASQVVLSMLFGLGLIAAAALSTLNALSWIDFKTAFFGYFSGGELGLPAAAIAGTILHHILTKSAALSNFRTLVYMIFTLGPLIIVFLFIGSNPGFKSGGLADFKLMLIWWFYIGLNVIWFLLIVSDGSDEGVDPLERARDEERSVDKIKSNKTRIG